MWRPDAVVRRHRTRARVVWVCLLLMVVIYVAWEISFIIIKSRNPSTSLTISNDLYKFPFVDICLSSGFGCSADDVSDCIKTSVAFGSSVTYGGVKMTGKIDEEFPGCLGFDLSSFDVGDGEISARTVADLSMVWVVGNGMDEVEDTYTESVEIYMGGIAGGGVSAALPYSRIVLGTGSQNFQLTAMTIGKTIRKFLSGKRITTYPVLTLSTTQRIVRQTSYIDCYNEFSFSDDYFNDNDYGDDDYSDNANSTGDDYSDNYYSDNDNDNDSAGDYYSDHSSSVRRLTKDNTTNLYDENSIVGTVSIGIFLGAYSLTTVKDVNPLDIGTFFGNIGGFWELMVVLWAACFVVHRRQAAPEFIGRNFSVAFRQRKGTDTKNNMVSASTWSKPEAVEEPVDWMRERAGSGGNNRAPI